MNDSDLDTGADEEEKLSNAMASGTSEQLTAAIEAAEAAGVESPKLEEARREAKMKAAKAKMKLEEELKILKLKAKIWGLIHYINHPNKNDYRPEFSVMGLSIEELSKIKLTTEEELNQEIADLYNHMGINKINKELAKEAAQRAVMNIIHMFKEKPEWIAMQKAEKKAEAAKMKKYEEESAELTRANMKKAEEEAAREAVKKAREVQIKVDEEKAYQALMANKRATAAAARAAAANEKQKRDELRRILIPTIGIITEEQLNELFEQKNILTADDFKTLAKNHSKLTQESDLTNQHLIDYYTELTKPKRLSLLSSLFYRPKGGKRRTKRRQNKSGKKSKKNKKRQRKGAKKSNKRPKTRH